MQALSANLVANIADLCLFWLVFKVKCPIISEIQLDFEFEDLYLFIVTREDVKDVFILVALRLGLCNGSRKKLHFILFYLIYFFFFR